MSNTTNENNAPQMPDMPPPVEEHAWLEKFVGEWETEAEISCEPGKPPMKSTGKASSRMLGGFWLIEESKGNSPEMPYSSVLTLGYDPKKQQYLGTWVDSMMCHLWKYEGTVNAGGTILSLDTAAEFSPNSGKLTQFKEVTEFKSPDHRVFTSSMLGDDGEWRTVVTVHSRRKK